MKCPSGKVVFLTRKRARTAARRTPNRRLSAYLCDHCGRWHLGKLPSVIRRGKIGRNGQ